MGFRGYVLAVVFGLVTAGCGSEPAPSLAPSPAPVPAPGPSPSPAPDPPFTISGRVTDIDSGAPLPATSVTIIDGTDLNQATTSTANGEFQLGGLTLGGRTLRFRREGYDSVFLGVRLTSDTSVSVQMRPAMESLAGTWTGTITRTAMSVPTPQTESIPELNVTQAGVEISGTFPNTIALFMATLANPSGIGATTSISGMLTLVEPRGGRDIVTCRGSGPMTGSVNWTRLTVTAPSVTFDCGYAYTNVTLSLVKQQ